MIDPESERRFHEAMSKAGESFHYQPITLRADLLTGAEGAFKRAFDAEFNQEVQDERDRAEMNRQFFGDRAWTPEELIALQPPALPRAQLLDLIYGGPMLTTTDPLDQKVTLKQLIKANATAARTLEKVYGANNIKPNFEEVLEQLKEDLKPKPTDFVKVGFGGNLPRYVYRIVNQPARRVQVGDLVTVSPNEYSTQPQITRVGAINVPAPRFSTKVAVAISPDDAERIESALGKVR